MDPQDLRRAAQDEIRRVLRNPALRGARLLEEIADLGTRHDIEAFRAALHAVARIDRPEVSARSLFEAIDQHRASLETRLGRDPGLSVAALDFLHDLEGLLRDPIFREADDPRGAAPGWPKAPGPASLDEVLALEVRRGERFGRPLAVAILAPDRPADAGERTMALAAVALRDAGRDTDHVARLLPDGFGVVFPCTGGEEGRRAAERLRLAAEASTGSPWSAGVAVCPDQPWEASALAAGAREALAAARAVGGSAVRLFRPERREHPRCGGVGASLTAALRTDGDELTASVEDLSVGGALLLTGRRVAPGSRVVVALRETSARPREMSVPSRVVRAEAAPPAPGGPAWRAGIVFLADAESRYRVAGLMADLLPRPRTAREARE